MKRKRLPARITWFDTFGGIASSSLIICMLSGIFLAIPYDVNEAYKSVSSLMIANPSASFFRNLHYWSAQMFLVFTIVHIFDHFIKKTEKNLQRYQWILLALSVSVVFYVMISGFILKGDPDARQAQRILSSLLSGIPWIGTLMQASLMGGENDLQLLYVHHVATATIILLIITYNHAGRIFSGAYPVFVTLFIAIILSFFFQAPLHDGFDPLMKGPWYFLGLQEMLHWMSRPTWVWLVFILILFMLIWIREVKYSSSAKIKLVLSFLAFIYLIFTVIGFYFRGENWEFHHPGNLLSGSRHGITYSPVITANVGAASEDGVIPYIFDRAEGCLVCHREMKGFSPAHEPSAIGCSSCHGGNPFTLARKAAHSDMVLIPGNLADAGRSCGTALCHPDIPYRVDRSLMATASGIVSVDRYVFGSSDSLSVFSHIMDIGHDAADRHLRDLCANCHLGMPKKEYGPITFGSRGGGCNACHLNYSGDALQELDRYRLSPDDFEFRHHPALNLNISDDHCSGCHSRSGRIALSYRGWHETLMEEDDVPDGHLLLEDRRVVELLEDDIHHRAGMMCTDCHLAVELMGDGNLFRHKEEQVRIRCEDCHFKGEPGWTAFTDLDLESRKIVQARYGAAGEDRKYLTLQQTGTYLLNIRETDSDTLFLERKADGRNLPLKPPAAACFTGENHKTLSCESCHTGWVPQCIGCHNEFDARADGMDLLEMNERQGSWVEYVAKFLHDRPVLGVQEIPGEQNKRVISFTPGMILSIALDSYPEKKPGAAGTFHRLYAPISAHTTMATGRDCVSCHLDPLALGYGRGELVYHFNDGKGKWELISHFALNPRDGLPEDAWTGFLQSREDQAATRYHMRPFNVEEQKSILTVGACLSCHHQDSETMKKSLVDFEDLLKQRSHKCILPDWD